MSGQTSRTRFASPGASGAGAGNTIKDEGAIVATGVTTFNFVGPGVTATPAGPGETTVSIPGGAGVPETEFVFRPGGVAGGNVYTSWAALYGAINVATQGPVAVYIDTSLGAATIPAGAYNLSQVRFEGLNTPTILTIAAGVTWTGAKDFRRLILTFLNTAPVDTTAQVVFLEQTTINATGSTAPIWTLASPFSSVVMRQGGGIAVGGVAEVFTINAPNTAIFTALEWIPFVSPIPAGTWGGNGNLIQITDGSISFPAYVPFFTGTASLQYMNKAANLGYTPGTPANWPVVPTEIASALDRLIQSFAGGAKGLVPDASGAGAGTYLDHNGNWTIPGGGGGGTLIPEYHTVTAPELAAKQFTLSSAPTVQFADLIGGGALEDGVDYSVVGNVFGWNGLGLDGLVAVGTKFRIVHD